MAWELHEVRLVGFKSFSRRTRIGLSNGLTAIVGSNGCGKTNIADAIRYALGEMRPHQLRVENLEDIIFAGTANAAPVMVAEVVLTFSDPATNDEFTITRRLSRGGDSEYRIDGQQARLKDVQRKLEQIGIVSHRGVVVELRHMDEVLIEGSKLPRQMIEEGCGIAPFLEKRNQAQQKLDEALKSLELLEPRIAQIQADLDRLAQQAQKSKRWRTTRDALDRAKNNEQWGEVRKLRKDAEEFNQQLSTLRTVNESEIRLAKLQTAIQDSQSQFESIQNSWESITNELFAIANKRESSSLRLKESELSKVRLDTLLGSSQEDLLRIEKEREESRPLQPTTLYKDLETATSECEQYIRERATIEEALVELNKQQDEFKLESAKFESLKENYSQRTESLKQTQLQLTEQLQELTPLTVPDAQTGIDFEHAIAENEKEQTSFQSLIEQQTKTVNEFEIKLRSTTDELTNIKSEHGRLEREIIWVERMLAERPDLTKELREFLSRHPNELHLLRDEGNDSAAVLYRIAEADRIQLAPDLFADVVKEALSGNLRCEWTSGTITEVVDLKRLLTENPPAGVEWMAIEGVSRDASGIVRTSGSGKSEVPVGLPKQVAVLKTKLDGLSDIEKRTNTGLSSIQAELQTAREHLSLATQQITKVRQNRVELDRKLMQFHATVAETESRNSMRMLERERIQQHITNITKELNQITASFSSMVAPAVPDLTNAITEATQKHAHVRQTQDEAEQHRQHIRIELRNFEIQQEQRKQKLVLLEQRHYDATTKISNYRIELESIGKKLETTRAELHELEQHEAQIRTKRTEIDPARAEAQDALRLLREQLEETRNLVEQWHTQIALLEEKLQQTRSTLVEKENAAVETGPEPKETVRVGIEEIQRLEQRLRSLEPVNHLAEQEFDSLKHEFDFLHSERDQIREAATIHRKSVDEAVRFAIERLTVARVQIERNFADIIARLFPGGEAALEWGEGDILSDAPLLLKVSPRGKRIRSLRILSGGERALVALAFLVSVLSQNRMLPFLVLDEVDAPLDEENTVRFLHWVKDLTATTQVVLLTHNRQTISASESWVGVMMPEPGISQVVKVIPALEET